MGVKSILITILGCVLLINNAVFVGSKHSPERNVLDEKAEEPSKYDVLNVIGARRDLKEMKNDFNVQTDGDDSLLKELQTLRMLLKTNTRRLKGKLRKRWLGGWNWSSSKSGSTETTPPPEPVQHCTLCDINKVDGW